MPGTPVLYYGDEIGMGDNIYLGDRDGVRTPMQWTPDRNGGFSKSDPAKLFLPAIQDPIYGFDAVNVESQLRSPASLLNWTRRMVSIRRNHRVFGRGSLRFLYPSNRKVLAYLREHEGEAILCVANLSRAPQAVELDSPNSRGHAVEMTGGSEFPRIGDLTLPAHAAGYGFYWFRSQHGREADAGEARPSPRLFTLVLTGPLDSLLKGGSAPRSSAPSRRSFIATRRWFGQRRDDLAHLGRRCGDPARPARADAFLLPRSAVEFSGGERHEYFAPMAVEEGREEEGLLPYAVARVSAGPRVGLMYGAASSPEFGIAMISAMKRGRRSPPAKARSASRNQRLQSGRSRSIPATFAGSARAEQHLHRLRLAQGHEALSAPSARHPPELEVARFLTEVAGFENTPALSAPPSTSRRTARPTALAVLQRFVRNQGDAWQWTLDLLRRELDVMAVSPEAEQPAEAFAPYAPIAWRSGAARESCTALSRRRRRSRLRGRTPCARGPRHRGCRRARAGRAGLCSARRLPATAREARRDAAHCSSPVARSASR
jgi:maltose alpha-D-glucosyltransferase/alpha-amylase